MFFFLVPSSFFQTPDTPSLPQAEDPGAPVSGVVTHPSLCSPLAGPSQGGPVVPDMAGVVGLFQEKPHSLQNNIRTSLEKKKRGPGVSWASRPEAAPQGQWQVWSVWGEGVGRACLVPGCGALWGKQIKFLLWFSCENKSLCSWVTVEWLVGG